MRQTAKKSSGKAKNSSKTSGKSSSPAKKIPVIAIVAVVLLAAVGFAYANNIRHQTPERIVSEDGVLHCYSKADEIMTSGWIDFEEKRYYAGEDGALYANRMESIGEEGYFYFGEDGAMLKDIFIAEDKVYSADPEGHINMTEGWEEHDGKTYYNKGEGVCLSSCKTTIDGEDYAFDSEGVLRKDQVFDADGEKFYADGDGKIVKSQPVEYKDKKYYAGETGAFVRNGFTKYEDYYFYINDDSSIAKEPVTMENGYVITPDPETGAISEKERKISESEYIHEGKATYIKVDRDSQTMIFVKDGELLLSSDVVTGLYGQYDTPGGEYEILYKARDVQLKGEQIIEGEYEDVPLTEEEKAAFKADPKNKGKKVPETKKVQKKDEWDVKVNYWLAFIGGNYGFHDATWRGEFGGYIYTWDGSHGCVNLPLWAAEFLYDNADEGTPVFIY